MLTTDVPRPRSLLHCERGLALIEFAISLPVLLIVGLTGLETANYALAHLRVSNIAAMVADGGSRYRDSIGEENVDDLFRGALMSGEAIDFEENGRIILSTLEPSPDTDDNVQYISWQRCAGQKVEYVSTHGRPLTESGTIIDNGTEYKAADRKTESNAPSSHEASDLIGVTAGGSTIAAQDGTAIVIAEAVYEYQPLLAGAALAGRVIRYRSAYNVRQRVSQRLLNVGAMTPLSCG